jgi:hypothetical protein
MRVRFLTLGLLLALAGGACSGDFGLSPIDFGEPEERGPHVFRFIPHPDNPEVTSVSVPGSFGPDGSPTFWNPGAEGFQMTLGTDGVWRLEVDLEPGTYQYKYHFNGDTWAGNMCNHGTWGNPEHGGRIDPDVQSCDGENAVLVIQ